MVNDYSLLGQNIKIIDIPNFNKLNSINIICSKTTNLNKNADSLLIHNLEKDINGTGAKFHLFIKRDGTIEQGININSVKYNLVICYAGGVTLKNGKLVNVPNDLNDKQLNTIKQILTNLKVNNKR